MAELIGALAEAIAGLFLIIAEALPALAELLVYLVIGSVTLIAYSLSRTFRERKRREWTERPTRRYLDVALSAAALALLILLVFWIFLPAAKQPKSSADATAQHDREFQFMISKQSDQNPNEVTMKISLKKGALSQLLRRKSRAKPNAVAQVPIPGVAVATNEIDYGISTAGTNVGSTRN